MITDYTDYVAVWFPSTYTLVNLNCLCVLWHWQVCLALYGKVEREYKCVFSASEILLHLPKRRKQKAGRQKAGETTIGFLSAVSLNLISFNRCPFILALSASRSTDKHCWAKYNCTFSKSVWNQWCCANFRKHASTATSSMDLHLCLTSVLFSGWVYAHNCTYAHKCTYTYELVI